MNLSEKLKVCASCQNHKWDKHRGTFCALTDEKPAFEEQCDSYIEDTANKHTASKEKTEHQTNVKAPKKTYKKLQEIEFFSMNNRSEIAEIILLWAARLVLLIAGIAIVFLFMTYVVHFFQDGSSIEEFFFMLFTLAGVAISSLITYATIIAFINISYRSTEIHKLLKKNEDKE